MSVCVCAKGLLFSLNFCWSFFASYFFFLFTLGTFWPRPFNLRASRTRPFVPKWQIITARQKNKKENEKPFEEEDESQETECGILFV